MSQRSYNHIYTFRRIVIQVLQQRQDQGLIVRLLPTVTLAILNDVCLVAFSFEWLTGDVNVGIMRRSFQKSEKERRQRVIDQARKLGVTRREYELRWGW